MSEDNNHKEVLELNLNIHEHLSPIKDRLTRVETAYEYIEKDMQSLNTKVDKHHTVVLSKLNELSSTIKSQSKYINMFLGGLFAAGTFGTIILNWDKILLLFGK